MAASYLLHGLHSQDEVWNEQFLFGLLLDLLFLGEWLEGLVKDRVFVGCEDIVLAFHLLVLRDLVAFDRQHLEHLHLLVRFTVVPDERFKALYLLQTQQRIQDLLVNDLFAALKQPPEASPLEICYLFLKILSEAQSTCSM